MVSLLTDVAFPLRLTFLSIYLECLVCVFVKLWLILCVPSKAQNLKN